MISMVTLEVHVRKYLKFIPKGHVAFRFSSVQKSSQKIIISMVTLDLHVREYEKFIPEGYVAFWFSDK